MKNLCILLGILCLSSPALARGYYFNYVQKGGNTVNTSGFISSTKVQKSYPGAIVTVYLAGTTTLAPLFSTLGGGAKANPFTAGSDGSFFFWIDSPSFDIKFSGTGITTSCGSTFSGYPCISAFTWSNQSFNGGSGTSALTISVLSYGAVCDGIVDDTAAIQSAIDVSGPHTVVFPSGTCLATDTLTISQNRVNLIGQGQQNTIIKFQPTSGGKPVFHLYHGSAASTIGQNIIQGFGFTSTDTTLQKIMVRVTDGEEIELSNLASSGGAWTGNTSIGVEIKGRQTINLHDSTLFSDEPIHIKQNPSFNGLDCDHCHFWNLYLGANGSANYNVTVDSNVVLTNFTIDGYEAWVKGKGGLSYPNSASSASSSISLSNIRHEQTENAAGYIVNIGSSANINSLFMHNIYGGSGMNGFKVRKTNQLTLSNCFYVGTAVSLDIDATVFETDWLNSFSGLTGATANLSGQYLLFSTATSGILSTSPIHTTAFYKSTTNTAPEVELNGAKFWSASGTLANAGQFHILNQTQGAGTDKAFIIIVAAKNNSTNAAEGGTVIVSGGASGQAALAGGTTNFGVGNVSGKLTILWQNVSTVTLLNQLGGGATVDYTITVIWN